MKKSSEIPLFTQDAYYTAYLKAAQLLSELPFFQIDGNPSYFARYYKSQTGHSPSEVRAGGNL